MKQFTRRVRPLGRAFFDIRSIVAVVGLFLSIALHELFHVVVHWGSITEAHLFPDGSTIVRIVSLTDTGYNPQLEEMIAYAITLLTMLATVAAVCYLSDKKDTRTTVQTLFPKDKSMQRLSRAEFFELATRINLL